MMERPNALLQIGAAIVVCVLVTSCEHADPLEPGGLEPTLESIQANIFNTSCAFAQCHAGPNPQANLVLTEGEARSNLVEVASQEIPSFKRIDPGNPDDSYLVMKLEGDARILGQRMPFNSPALSSEEIGVIREWITNGAP